MATRMFFPFVLLAFAQFNQPARNVSSAQAASVHFNVSEKSQSFLDYFATSQLDGIIICSSNIIYNRKRFVRVASRIVFLYASLTVMLIKNEVRGDREGDQNYFNFFLNKENFTINDECH